MVGYSAASVSLEFLHFEVLSVVCTCIYYEYCLTHAFRRKTGECSGFLTSCCDTRLDLVYVEEFARSLTGRGFFWLPSFAYNLLLRPLDDHHFGDSSVVHMREDAVGFFGIFLICCWYDPLTLRLFETREEMGGTT